MCVRPFVTRHTLEHNVVFIESIGQCVQGTVLCVAAGNLAAHGLASFLESFSADFMCRFCTATRDQFQTHEVGEGEFSRRTRATHDLNLQDVLNGQSQYGVKLDCVLSHTLQYFHAITGFRPNILHDLLEVIVPVDLALCISETIRLKYFTLEYLNQKMVSFPYQYADKINRPHPIPKTFATKGTIGGNGHENATLLRLLPLMVGSDMPEGDGAWAVLMDLKDVVELVLSPTFTAETVQYLQSKINDHRQTLQEVFPGFRLRPKHQYVEHYPELINYYGALVHLWTMRFQGKHRFFKRVVHSELQECPGNCQPAPTHDGILPQCTIIFVTSAIVSTLPK